MIIFFLFSPESQSWSFYCPGSYNSCFMYFIYFHSLWYKDYYKGSLLYHDEVQALLLPLRFLSSYHGISICCPRLSVLYTQAVWKIGYFFNLKLIFSLILENFIHFFSLNTIFSSFSLILFPKILLDLCCIFS